MNILIAGNWKMNPQTKKEAEELAEKVAAFVPLKRDSGAPVEVLICPPFVYLAEVSLKRNEGGFVLGAQNCFYEEKGAFTGEVSAQILKDAGCQYVIAGHSERRKYFGETDEIVNKKIKAILGAGLAPIFCAGETKDQRDSQNAENVVERQIKEGLKDISATDKLVLAYEPVWAIGTGNACSWQDAEAMKNHIKKFLPEGVRILYGGSVTSQNCAEYIKQAGFDGLLVGGASLNAEEFGKIIKNSE